MVPWSLRVKGGAAALTDRLGMFGTGDSEMVNHPLLSAPDITLILDVPHSGAVSFVILQHVVVVGVQLCRADRIVGHQCSASTL